MDTFIAVAGVLIAAATFGYTVYRDIKSRPKPTEKGTDTLDAVEDSDSLEQGGHSVG